VDRTRIVAAQLASIGPGTPSHQAHVRQLEKLQVRSSFLLAALRLFYASLGSFAAAALISVIGSTLAFYGWQFVFRVAAIVGLAIGALGVTGLVSGCTLMVRETRLAVQTLAEEAGLSGSRQ
jgi:MFS family permease